MTKRTHPCSTILLYIRRATFVEIEIDAKKFGLWLDSSLGFIVVVVSLAWTGSHDAPPTTVAKLAAHQAAEQAADIAG